MLAYIYSIPLKFNTPDIDGNCRLYMKCPDALMAPIQQ